MASNFFRKPIPDLKPGTYYSFKFQWKYSDGTTGPYSAAKTVLTAGTATVDTPTKATGLTAKTAAFGLLVSWDGTYADNDYFNGFKSINIYASSTNLGSSTTEITDELLVGSMTVDAVKNSITLGLENLKDVLDLNSTTVYTQDIYLYYIAVNENDEKYQESGEDTYYRINETALHPTKANYIDLANGVISIENLVAGNGQFTSWLRAGLYGTAPGGARIELSALNSFTADSGGLVSPGLNIYDSSGNKAFAADLQGNVSLSGRFKTTTEDLDDSSAFISTHNPYIEIPRNTADIKFFMENTAGSSNNPTTYGKISYYQEPQVHGLDEVGINIIPPTYNQNLTSTAQFKITEYKNTGQDPTSSIYATADYVQIGSLGGQYSSGSQLLLHGTTIQIAANSGVELMYGSDEASMFVRNIKATTSAPSAGSSASAYRDGEIWFQYTA
jgi:hypothetical protein